MKKPGILRGLTLALALAGCATTPAQRGAAVQRLNGVWVAENQATRAKVGARIIVATPGQIQRALTTALPAIGLDIDAQASSATTVVAASHYAKSGFSWGPAIRAQEEARMRKIFIDAIGPQGGNLTLVPQNEIITATSRIAASTATSARLTVDFRSSSPAGGCPAETSCIDEIPPAALNAAYYQFWTAFEPALDEVLQTDAKAAASRAKRRPAPDAPRKPASKRPPSDWVLPPSGWRPPQ
jgi:hypothetical protein